MPMFRKRPIVVEAHEYDGSLESAIWMGPPEYVQDFLGRLEIQTLEGSIFADKGDLIIKGIKGEFYPCEPDIFEATYEEVV